MKLRTILIFLNIAGLLGALIWLLTEPSWEPLVTSIGLIAALVVQLFSNGENSDIVVMKQKGGKGSTNYQSKGDINIR